MPENVKELMEEMKNLSELMLDFAYSSVFFESKDIAKEVILLYERLEEVEEKLYIHLFAASRGRLQRKFTSVLELVESTKAIAHAAKNISKIVLEGKELHPIIKETLKNNDETITRVVVTKNSMLKDRALGELKLRTKIGINIIAIRRMGRWIFGKKKNRKLNEGDTLVGVGPSSACESLRKIAKGLVKRL